ncbi:MAG: YfiR family protein [Candidatus Latescibacterota bacterium]
MLGGGVTLAGLPVRVVRLDFGDSEELRARVSELGVDVIYVPELRGIGVEAVTALSRELQVLTFAGIEDYVHQGVSVGVGERAGRPHIWINTTAARAEGAAFSAELLKLVSIVGANAEDRE